MLTLCLHPCTLQVGCTVSLQCAFHSKSREEEEEEEEGQRFKERTKREKRGEERKVCEISARKKREGKEGKELTGAISPDRTEPLLWFLTAHDP